MSRFVLDASVTVAWCFEDETNPYTEGVLDTLARGEALVPFIWPLEVGNALLTAERRKRVTRAKVGRLLQVLMGFAIVIDTDGISKAFAEILSVGREHSLSAYDAAYLELAIRHGMPLATLDTNLRKAAKHAGVPLLG